MCIERMIAKPHVTVTTKKHLGTWLKTSSFVTVILHILAIYG